MEEEGNGHYKEWRKREREGALTIRNGERGKGKGHYKEWRKRERERGTIRNGERGKGAL